MYDTMYPFALLLVYIDSRAFAIQMRRGFAKAFDITECRTLCGSKTTRYAEIKVNWVSTALLLCIFVSLYLCIFVSLFLCCVVAVRLLLLSLVSYSFRPFSLSFIGLVGK